MSMVQLPITDASFIVDLIPQKWPFVMVDKLYGFSENEIISGLTIKEENLLYFGNEFTEPGLVENMAQTVAMHKGYTYYLRNEPAPVGYIGAIKKAEIYALPKLGDELRTTVTILHDIMGVTLVKAKIECNQKIIATSEIKTALA
jgi:3-hydroxymyristoyl/3-hydroxydecanoyl-(acyl carrier protein) dehydratase